VRTVAVAALTPLITDGDPLLDHVMLAVTFEDAAVQHYQLLVARTATPKGELEHVTFGAVDDRLAYDGLWDTRITKWLLEAIREGRTVGDIRFAPEPDAAIAQGVAGRVLPGVNPDLELHRALRSVGSHEAAALQGAVEGMLDGEPVTLAMLQDFAANSADGWSMALASVRDLLAEGDLRADEVGGDFAGEASRLGETIAVVHDELRRALGGGQRDARELAASWHARLDSTSAAVPALAPHVGAIRDAYDAVAGLAAPVPTQRVHGDLHLGQTLRTPRGWLVIDFEGEPAAPLAERVAPDSALRDVAGMLRSFDYAAFHQLLRHDPTALDDPQRDSQLAWHANEWAERNRAAFCDGYSLRAGTDPRDHGALLRAFELDKAVYELLYETRSRPAWAPIPLASIGRLTEDAGVR